MLDGINNVGTGIGSIGTLNGNVEFNVKLPKLKSSIEKLEKDFYKGEIKDSIEYLHSLLDEYDEYPQIKYQLLVKKVSFLFSVREYKKAIQLLNNIEKNYTDFIDINYEEVKLIELSLNKKEEDFFLLVDKIISESTKDLEEKNFQLMYYLNSENIDKAREVFENLDDKLKNNEDMSLLGGHIYSSLDDYSNANKYYKLALSFDISFLDKVIIYGFYGTGIINKLMTRQITSENKELISNYKEIIEKILTESEYYEKLYIKNLKNIFLYLFIVVDDINGYIQFYEQEPKNEFLDTRHYFQYSSLKKIPIEHEKIQEIILKGNEEVLLQYAQSLENDHSDLCLEIVNFLERNFELIYKNQFVLFFYTQWKIKENSNFDRAFITYLSSQKYKNFEYLISYINFLKSTKTSLLTEDINKLLELTYSEKNVFSRILNTLYILNDLGQRKEYLKLALNKEQEFKYVIEETLKLCYNDKNLLIDEFSYFVNNISNQEMYYSSISNIYQRYSDYKLSFDFLFKEYRKNSEKNTILLHILQISINHFIKTKDIYEKRKQQEVYNLLISRKDDLSIFETIFLLQYSIMILKDTKQILPFLNQYLLSTNITDLEEEIKINLSNLFTQTSFDITKYNDLFIYDDNICLVKEGIIYIKDSHTIIEENQNSLNFRLIDDNEFFLMTKDTKAVEESLFHRVIGTFAFR
ncbi:MAG TPA: hypothetical protein ENK66_04880, partial [Arcobacter sp.]|nr:hypothetical protein [Arcobacter sp.]